MNALRLRLIVRLLRKVPVGTRYATTNESGDPVDVQITYTTRFRTEP